jgi:2-polyprenyl-3-methyl-5-hydroxy-6-metoxy-1,4-benzoquinol methylase
MVDIIECPVCKSRSIKPFRICKDFTVSHETFAVNRCDVCTLGITSPRPETENLGRYYQSEEYISHSGKSSGLMGPIYTTARKFALNWKTGIVKSQSKKGTALDFGCGTGEFLQTLKTRGWVIEGVEPSDLARKKAESLTNQKLHSSLSEISTKQFDSITAWHVVEHVPDLSSVIQQLAQLLKKDGTIFIAVPNYESPDAEKYNDLWAGYDVPRHLWHFSRKSMKQLLEAHGLNVIKIIPMKLDAYYVSMLSENYKNGTKGSVGNLIKGFFSGFKSNLEAGSNNNSSLIYIAKLL